MKLKDTFDKDEYALKHILKFTNMTWEEYNKKVHERDARLEELMLFSYSEGFRVALELAQSEIDLLTYENKELEKVAESWMKKCDKLKSKYEPNFGEYND